ncbi:MAG: pyridoxal-phosphate dependent enzyme [Armatimonadota bacterium]|nr:pyridoxal-phosphate dependent enzyme [Armatimonadota bacterium]MDR7426979.1 pyridoxal-phosphate dependent enzyme [Armatimonadota bacterium]MDR7463103.1 pyridoxal-phosphate dependent enzyme [Armatimonadota bacterium]MDR7469314.1 pyridoxal-phosphate dependent enzyme [Armatimonadota bacterium]MDR7475520.1 pyridoxal-phosphate dependent enzyme [Armatimonadota bacterium]
MSTLPSAVVCAGCGYQARGDEPYPFRCPNAVPGDDTDHVMTVRLDWPRLRWPEGGEANPFLRFRTLLHSYHLAAARGMDDAAYVALVQELDGAVAAVNGRGFVVTPFGRQDDLSRRLGFASGGGVWVKDETGNVSGSHKARHLMGLLLYLEVVERVGPAPAGRGAHLAIASCGNAALAAAVVARAAGRPLRVFIPTVADPKVVARLRALEAELTICPREAGTPGDPTYHRLRQAVREGALPFTCQGSDNGLTIEGGKTLGYEMVAALAGGQGLDRVFVQVGGGALASAVVQALEDARELGVLAHLPRIHAVQARAVQPLVRAYDGVAGRILERIGREEGRGPAPPGGARERADLIRDHATSPQVAEELNYAVTHRSQFMWPWEAEPRSVAGGIIDDETYDWAAVVRGMVVSGGYPLAVSEEELLEAHALARSATGIAVDPTGSAGLAGLLQLVRGGQVDPQERVAVLFTGVQR